MSSALLSTFHLLALGIGLPGVFLRGLAMRGIIKGQAGAVERLLSADNAWGVAAILWLITGLARAFGPFEKGSDYYLSSGPFLVKMGLFVLILVLELWPMITFIRWRIKQAKQQPIELSVVPRLKVINDLEVGLTVAMPFFASMMARGQGMGWF